MVQTCEAVSARFKPLRTLVRHCLMGAVQTEKKKGSEGKGSTANTSVDLKAFQPKDMKTLNQSMQSMLKFKAAKESFC